jgi:hypothetical protein
VVTLPSAFTVERFDHEPPSSVVELSNVKNAPGSDENVIPNSSRLDGFCVKPDEVITGASGTTPLKIKEVF